MKTLFGISTSWIILLMLGLSLNLNAQPNNPNRQKDYLGKSVNTSRFIDHNNDGICDNSYFIRGGNRGHHYGHFSRNKDFNRKTFKDFNHNGICDKFEKRHHKIHKNNKKFGKSGFPNKVNGNGSISNRSNKR